MAQVTGRPGYDALRKSREELDHARIALDEALRSDRLYSEQEISRLCDAVAKPMNWLRGAEGECRTARALDDLSDDFVVYHDFHIKKRDGSRATWNIDHIVVGPTGLYVVDSKNHRASSVGLDDVKRHAVHVLRQALDVRDWVISRLPSDSTISLFVRGVVVYARGEVMIERLAKKEVWILPVEVVSRRLQEAKRRLTPTDVATIRRALNGTRALTPPMIP